MLHLFHYNEIHGNSAYVYQFSNRKTSTSTTWSAKQKNYRKISAYSEYLPKILADIPNYFKLSLNYLNYENSSKRMFFLNIFFRTSFFNQNFL